MAYATIAAATSAAPQSNLGRPIVPGDPRRIVFQVLFPSGPPQTPHEWWDLTGDVRGFEFSRGAAAAAIAPSAGTGILELESVRHTYAPWNDSPDSFQGIGLGEHFGPGVVWRCVVHDPTGVWEPEQHPGEHWLPVVTGRVEDWTEPATSGLGAEVIAVLRLTDTFPDVADEFSSPYVHPVASLESQVRGLIDGPGSWSKTPWPINYHGPVAPDPADVLIPGVHAYSGSVSDLVRLYAAGIHAELWVDRYGESVFAPISYAGWLPPNPFTPPPGRTINTSATPEGVVSTFDMGTIVNLVEYADANGTSTVSSIDTASIDRYGQRTLTRDDLHTDNTSGILQAVADAVRDFRDNGRQWITGLELTLDHAPLDDLLELDLQSVVDIYHTPPTSPVAVEFSAAAVRRIRHRMHPLNDGEISWTATYSAENDGRVTWAGLPRRTADNIGRRTAAGIDRATPVANFRYHP